jgi:hypothetical protein
VEFQSLRNQILYLSHIIRYALQQLYTSCMKLKIQFIFMLPYHCHHLLLLFFCFCFWTKCIEWTQMTHPLCNFRFSQWGKVRFRCTEHCHISTVLHDVKSKELNLKCLLVCMLHLWNCWIDFSQTWYWNFILKGFWSGDYLAFVR